MSALLAGVAGGLLSAEEWETRLVSHYLRSDGPSGGGTMTFLDATPAEIATASGIEGLGEEDAQTAFIAQFRLGHVSDWLSGARVPPADDRVLPGYFRYLVLTALVSATEAGAGETQDFRIRLGELLQVGGRFSSVSGVNALWRALVGWCERKRTAGEPYRRIELPSYGNANLIGYAVRMAFPSWVDRRALTHVLRSLPPEVRRSPVRLTQELARSRYVQVLPQAVALALHDFDRAVRARRHMLLGDRFWRLVLSIEAGLPDGDRGGRRMRWHLEVRFEGYELDVPRVTLVRGHGLPNAVPSWTGALQELEALPRLALPKELASALDQGVLVLSEAPGLTWVADEESPPEGAYAMLVAREGSAALTWPLHTTWRSLEGRWLASARLDGPALDGLRRGLGLQPAGATRLVDLTFEGGVRTDRTAWLGRPGFLPAVLASTTSTLSVAPVGGAEGMLSVAGCAPSWDLLADGPLSGRWWVQAAEDGSETEKVVHFEPTARERWEFPDLGAAYEPERDVSPTGVSHWKPRPPAGRHPAMASKLEDALEAVYAGPPRGWPEADLIRLLAPAMPRKHFVWDFVRGLAEAEWLDPFVLKSWRARVWRLRPPSLRRIAPGRIVVAGALGAVARARLRDVAVAAGGELGFLPGVSQWAVPLPLVEGVAVEDLAGQLGWPITVPERPQLKPAPGCWPAEPRSGQGRRLQGVWSFDAGLFQASDGTPGLHAVGLERLIRERGDDRDVYRVTGQAEAFLTSSRTAAILEAHRCLGRPLFAWRGGKFHRLGRSGHLPLEIARSLVAHASQASGPIVRSDGTWTYEYPADPATAGWVARTLGSAIRHDTAGAEADILKQIVARRRAGGRLVWSEPLARGMRP